MKGNKQKQRLIRQTRQRAVKQASSGREAGGLAQTQRVWGSKTLDSLDYARECARSQNGKPDALVRLSRIPLKHT